MTACVEGSEDLYDRVRDLCRWVGLPERWECHVINRMPERHHGAAPPSPNFSLLLDLILEWLDSS